MDRSFDGSQELPKRRSGVVAQHRTVAAGEHCCHPAPVPTRSAVAYGVDAAVEAVQTSASYAPSRRALTHTERFELPQRDYPVLPICDFRERCVGRVALVTHEVTKATRPSDPPPYLLLFLARCGYCCSRTGEVASSTSSCSSPLPSAGTV